MTRRTLLTSSLAAFAPIAAQSAKQPSIKFNKVPPFDPAGGPDRMDAVSGTVSGVEAQNCKVLLYARTNTWYVQPLAAAPYTKLTPDNAWRTTSHLGVEYAALLVTSSHSDAPATRDELPPIGGDVLAIDIRSRK